jgi:hypothetical protein
MMSPVYLKAGDPFGSLNILIFSKTNDYRHESTEEAKLAMADLCREYFWEYYLTEDSSIFYDSFLERFDVVVFLLTSGNILDTIQQESLIRYIRSGKGLVTIHSGSFTEMSWPWWGKSVCARFTGHPPEQEGRLIIEDFTHPATRHLENSMWMVKDEFYSFDKNPRECAQVLISVDEDSYDVDDNQWFPGVNQRMGDHPLVWCKEFEGGKIFQSALGHNADLYQNKMHRKLLAGAIIWAAGKSN